jgi:hypothetical protein
MCKKDIDILRYGDGESSSSSEVCVESVFNFIGHVINPYGGPWGVQATVFDITDLEAQNPSYDFKLFYIEPVEPCFNNVGAIVEEIKIVLPSTVRGYCDCADYWDKFHTSSSSESVNNESSSSESVGNNSSSTSSFGLDCEIGEVIIGGPNSLFFQTTNTSLYGFGDIVQVFISEGPCAGVYTGTIGTIISGTGVYVNGISPGLACLADSRFDAELCLVDPVSSSSSTSSSSSSSSSSTSSSSSSSEGFSSSSSSNSSSSQSGAPSINCGDCPSPGAATLSCQFQFNDTSNCCGVGSVVNETYTLTRYADRSWTGVGSQSEVVLYCAGGNWIMDISLGLCTEVGNSGEIVAMNCDGTGTVVMDLDNGGVCGVATITLS